MSEEDDNEKNDKMEKYSKRQIIFYVQFYMANANGR